MRDRVSGPIRVQWLGHYDPATTLRHYVRLTTAARAKAVAGLDEVTRAALEAAEEKAADDAQPCPDNVVTLASRRRQSFRWPSFIPTVTDAVKVVVLANEVLGGQAG